MAGKYGRRHYPTTADLQEWFADRTEPEPNTGCLLFFGAAGPEGRDRYGLVRYWRGDEYRRERATRVAYEMAHGPIPDGMQVCHRCDTPECVNADHFFLGTNLDNVADRVAKGRQRNRPLVHRALKQERAPVRVDACMAGHPWTAETTYVNPRGLRTCRVCKLRRQQEYQARKAKGTVHVSFP